MMLPSKSANPRTRLVITAGLIVLTTAAYWLTLGNGFAFFDDDGYVVENTAVRQGLTAKSLAYAWTTLDLANWLPLTWMSLELDYTLWGMNAPGFHATDLALHIASVCLLFHLTVRMSGSVGRSALFAAFWAVHPLHVESVAWIAERKDTLSTFFLLLSLVCYERYAVRLQYGWYAGMIAAFVLGMLSKQMLVTLPVLLLLLDYWPLQRWRGGRQMATENRYPVQTTARLLIEKLPLLAGALAFAGVAFWAQSLGSAVASLEMLPLSLRLENALESCGWYLVKTLVPTELAPYYPLRSHPIDWVRLAGSAALLAGISAWAIAGLRRRPWLAVGWLWFLISILPVIGIVQLGIAAHADRYTYVPHIGLLFALVWEADYWLSQLPRGAALKALLAAPLLAISFEFTYLQVGYWYDPRSLWNHALEIDPANWMAHVHLGRDCLKQNDAKAALQHLEDAIALNPHCIEGHLIAGAIHQHFRRRDLAERYYRSALQVDPDNATALMNLGVICRQSDRLPEARQYLERCLAAHPEATRARAELDQVERQERESLTRQE